MANPKRLYDGPASIRVYLSASEKAAIQAKAAKAMIPASRLVREAALKHLGITRSEVGR